MSEISHLAARLKSALESLDWLGRPVFPKLREPATREELEAFEKTIGRKIPPSYRAFLRLHNGMEGLEQYDWGIAGTTPGKTGESFDDVRSGHQFVYKEQDPKGQALKDLKRATIVGSDFDFQVVYFAPESWIDDEPQVRRISSDQPYDELPLFENFEEFLEFLVSIYEDLVDMQNDSFEDDEEGDDDDLGGGQDDLLKELAAILRADEVRKRAEAEAADPPVKMTPEMEMASLLCHRALEMLVESEMIELVEGPGMVEALEDLMLRKLLRSSNRRETVSRWIDSLSRAREVEELYGTDEQLAVVLDKAFDEVKP